MNEKEKQQLSERIRVIEILRNKIAETGAVIKELRVECECQMQWQSANNIEQAQINLVVAINRMDEIITSLKKHASNKHN